MANMKFTQLSTAEFKLDSVTDFCLNSYGNCMVLIGNSKDVTILELINSCDTMVLMPYSNKPFRTSQEKPISKIIRGIDLVKIYEESSVQESQELALDVIYSAECAAEPLKARVMQADIITKNFTNICCILTTYGYCEIYKKTAITEEWKPLSTNLSNILITDVFPLKVSRTHIKTFNDLKTFINKFIITSFVMSLRVSDLIIYLGTAAGYVIAVKYIETSNKFEECGHIKTSLNRICYITTYNKFVLVGCDQGKVRLLKINFENNCFQELDYLWSKSDRMTCRKAMFTYSQELKTYFLVFCKAAHFLAYRLDLEGVVLSSSTLYVSGIKITGIESISKNEFIITTITGTIKCIKLICSTKEELNIEEQLIEHEFDSSNYQLLGITASPSKNLFSFILYRNKDYVHQSKYSASSAFLNVCKLSGYDSFIKLINSNWKNMNMAHDLVLGINLEIFNNMELDKYLDYLSLEKLKFPEQINDAFLLKMQIKIIVTRKIYTYQNIKYRKIKTQIKNELQILEPALQLLHILSRLRYLKEMKLSNFQELSIVCMQLQYSHLLNCIVAIKNIEEENSIQRKTVVKFLSYFVVEFEKNKFHTDNFTKTTEYCMMCDQPITNFIKCEQDHEIKRCSISFTQLSIFKTKYCPHCYALARNDDEAKLHELYSPDDSITCIYCRFLFKQDVF